MSRGRVSVIMPAHDAEKTLAACVRGVFAGTRTPDEIVVDDEASTDVARAIARGERSLLGRGRD